MLITLNNIAKSFLIFAFISFLFLGVFGLSHFNMNMGMDGKMSVEDCPFMIGGVICKMSPFEHISMWQSFFTSIPSQNITLLILLLVSVVLFVFWIKRLFSPPRNLFTQPNFGEYSKYIPLTHSFQELFSNGILNPKLF